MPHYTILQWLRFYLPNPRPTTFCTTDLTLGAYLMTVGSKVEGYSRMDNGVLNFVFSRRNILRCVHDYGACRPILFSPKLFENQRYLLKIIDHNPRAGKSANPSPDFKS